ncbi:ankyrin repeat domain-containing protein 17-like [Coccinella septempunctata]|uniref:ankyrin repeat domain-containing protein 17-like n=1 Tax=Coccinella septempunctata TaxID=41139 RepID=UPI001D05C84A|nr:ankyrin repeat domain-containing protein 17-like [Coccinella septempunctata]
MRELLEMGANMKWTDRMGFNYIHQVVFTGHYTMIKYLVEFGVDIKHQARFRWFQPIHFCSVFPNKEKGLKELLKYGAQLDAVDYLGYTLLHFLVKKWPHRDLRYIQKLLDYGFDPNATSKGGISCLQIIAASDLCTPKQVLSLARMFIKRGVDINNVTTHNQQTSLHMACSTEKTSLVDLLLREGAIDTRCKIGSTAFGQLFNGNYPKMDIIVIFIKHFALKKRRGETVEATVSNEIAHNVYLQKIYRKYEEDLNRLQSIKIVESHRVTLHDVLCCKISEVVEYLSSASVRDNIFPLKVSTFFSREIRHRYRKTMEIIEFEEESCRVIHEISHGKLPYSCLRQISKYLSERDVKELPAFLRNDNLNRKM